MTAPSIASFIPYYPPVGPSFAGDIAHLKEFYDLRLESGEDAVPGELLKHQEFMRRFINGNTPYPSMLVIHGMGVGKTLLAEAVAEATKGIEGYNKPLIIVKSDTFVNIFRNELVRFWPEIYRPRHTEADLREGATKLDPESQKYQARLNRNVNRFYDIGTFDTFLPSLVDLPDSTLRKRYSNRLIIIDEVHNIRKHGAGMKAKDGDRRYKEAWRLLHAVEGCRVMLMSGTPMWDVPSEIAAHMNLLLPKDQQLPMGGAFNKHFFDAKGHLIPERASELTDVFRGRVSVLRPLTSTARRIEMGVTRPYTSFVQIAVDEMSEMQAKAADGALKHEKQVKLKKAGGKDVHRIVVGGTVFSDAIQAANFVFSDGTYGDKGFTKYCVQSLTTHTGGTAIRHRLDKETAAIVHPLNNLRKYSSKFAAIVEDILTHPTEVTLVYTSDVKGGGAILLSLVLQKYGFERLTTANVGDNPARRVAVATSDEETISRTRMFDKFARTFNDPKNRYGDYVQVLILSRKYSEGISLKNVRRVHVLGPTWNISHMDQAIFRALRFGSHQALEPDERTVQIFRHAAVDPAKRESTTAKLETDEIQNIDIYIYRVAEAKDFRTAQITRLLKVASVDCPLTYARNVLSNDVNNTRDCDYTTCNYVCDGMEPSWRGGGDATDVRALGRKRGTAGGGGGGTATAGGGTAVWRYDIAEEDIDATNYNYLYADTRVGDIARHIVELFRSHFILHLQTIYDMTGVGDRNLLLAALNSIIATKAPLRDRYGFVCYLKEVKNIYFLDKDISINSDMLMNVYVAKPFVVDTVAMEESIEILTLQSDVAKVRKLCLNIEENRDRDTSAWYTLNYSTQILLVEHIYQMLETEDFDGREDVRQTLLSLLELAGDAIQILKDGTVVHGLYNQEYTGMAYNVAAQNIVAKGRMRVFDSTLKRWHDLNDMVKEQNYISEIRNKIVATKQVGFEDNPYGVYGNISLKDGKFRIVFKDDGTKEGEGQRSRGLICGTGKATYAMLIDLMFRLGHLPKHSPNLKSVDDETIIAQIKAIGKIPDKYKTDEFLAKYTPKQRKQMLTMFGMKVTGEGNTLCSELKEWFRSHSLLYTY